MTIYRPRLDSLFWIAVVVIVIGGIGQLFYWFVKRRNR